MAVAVVLIRQILAASAGNERMAEIAGAVQEGAKAYLSRQVAAVSLIAVVLFAAIWWARGSITALGFVVGALCSLAAGFIGMHVAVRANVRTAQAASVGAHPALKIAFNGGAVTGLLVVALGLLSVGVFYLVVQKITGETKPAIESLIGLALGSSLISVFARLGGGIYTKAADVGADLVGKNEQNLPEDDPRNPATIADNVGDNVGDVAGMGADLYESYLASILSAAALGVAGSATVQGELEYLAAPMMLAGLGVLVSIFGIFRVRAEEGATMKQLMTTLERSIQISAVLIALIAYPLLDMLSTRGFENHTVAQVWWCLVIGLVVGISIGRITEYYTSGEYKPTQGIAQQAETGPGTVIIDGLAVGMRSTGLPVLVVVFGSGLAFFIANGEASTLQGLFGVAIAAVGMLSTLGITLATDAYGPIADNAGGNAEMAHLPPEVRERTDQLDALGNTTAATGKGFAIGSAALTGLALLASYVEQIRFSLERSGVETLNVDTGSFDVSTMSIDQFMQAYEVNPLNPMFLLGSFIG
ncbi:MAG: sodium-translocating pyrophosphatase, partial [Anaerolineae bacterium]|nr:sodium-translocating pyrophosphatase [Anaerolineae bacterium]